MLDPQEISDRLEIAEVLTRYSTAIDSKDFDLLDDVFTEDSTIDYSSSVPGVLGSLAEMKAWLSDVLGGFTMTQHLVSNTSYEIQGDRAMTRTMFFYPMRWQDDTGKLQTFFVGGYYEDELIKTVNGWRIRLRVEQQRWSTGPRPASLVKG